MFLKHQLHQLIFFFLLMILNYGCNGSKSKSNSNSGKGESSTPATGSSPTLGFTPTVGVDALAPYMWHLNNVSTKYVNNQTSTKDQNINLGNVHETTMGSGVMVVVSDSRVDLTHPELVENALEFLSKDYRKSSPYTGIPTSSNSEDGHGTAVAGVILAAKNNSIGGFGVAPKASLIGLNYVASDQTLSKTLDQASLSGHEGVFNYSYGYANCMVNSGEEKEYADHLRHNSITNNHVYVTAAGNDFRGNTSKCLKNSEKLYLGNANLDQVKTFPYMIVVGASTAKGLSAEYSTPGSNVWISAPGGDGLMGIMVPDLVGCSEGFSLRAQASFDKTSSALNPNCSFYSSTAGTSFATPIVSGGISILKAINPNLSWRDLKHILAKTAVKLQPTATAVNHPLNLDLPGHTYEYGWITNKASYSFHPWFGFGQMNLTAAVNLAKNPNFNLYEFKLSQSLDGSPSYSSGALNLSIPDVSATGVTSTISVTGHNLFIEHVQVVVDITHPAPSDLGIELISPSGTKTKLLNINSGMIGTNLYKVYFGANGFYGERSRGVWTLKVVDGLGENLGTLNNWTLTIAGNRGALLPDVILPEPVSNFKKSGSQLTWTPSPSGDLARYELCISPSGINDGCIEGDWRTVPAGTSSLTLSHYVYKGQVAPLISGESYSAKMRSVDQNENESNSITLTWGWP